MEKNFNGSITIYLSLSLTIIMAVLGLIIESARDVSLSARLSEATFMAEDALFSEYIASMYEDYGIMAFYKTDEEICGKIKDYCNFNLDPHSVFNKNYNFLKAKSKNVEITEANYITDYGAKAFIEQACEYIKYFAPKEAARKLLENMNTVNTASNDVESSFADEGFEENEDYQKTKNLLDWIKDLVDSGSLLFVTDESALSKKCVDQSNLPSEIAYNDKDNGAGLLEKAEMSVYYSNNFACFTDEHKEDNPLDYEMEYIFAGKDSDKANLASVVRSLSLMRQGLDFAYLLTDKQKQAEAEAVALTISAVILNPELEKPIEYLLLALWSYAESQADVKALLAGDKVSLLKTADEWQTSVSSIFSFSDTVEAAGGIKEEKGLSYKEYLSMLIATKKLTKTAFNALDIIQMNIQKKEETVFMMSGAITGLTVNASFESNMPFSAFVFVKKLIGKQAGSKYEKTITQSYSY